MILDYSNSLKVCKRTELRGDKPVATVAGRFNRKITSGQRIAERSNQPLLIPLPAPVAAMAPLIIEFVAYF